MENIVILLIFLEVVCCAPFFNNDTNVNTNFDDVSGETIDIEEFFETMPDTSELKEMEKDAQEQQQAEDEWRERRKRDVANWFDEWRERRKRHVITWSFDGQNFSINKKKSQIWQDEKNNKILENEAGVGIGWTSYTNRIGHPRLNSAKARFDFTNKAMGASGYANAEILPNNGGERIGTGFSYNLYRGQKTNLILGGNYDLNFVNNGTKSDYSVNLKMDF